MKKVFVVFIAVMLFVTMNASAITLTSWYDPETCMVNINGDGDGIITVMVAPESVSSDSLSASNLPSYYHHIEGDGRYEFSFPLPQNIGDGKYVVYVSNETGVATGTFISYDISVANNIVNELNSKSDEDFVLTASSDAVAKSLGIDVTGDDYSPSTMVLMRKLYPSFEDSIDFLSKYNFCHAINSLSGKTPAELENNLKKYQSFLGISYSDDYELNTNLSDVTKQTLCNYLSKVDYALIYKNAMDITGEDDFKAVLYASMALADAQNVENWKGMERLYIQSYPFLKTSIVYANPLYSSSVSDRVFAEVNKLKFNDITDLKANFDAGVISAFKPAATPSGGGGGGASIGSTSVPSSSPSGSSSPETLPTVNTGDLGVTCSLPQVKYEKREFSDVLSNDWYYDAVSSLSSMGVISGYEDGSFSPQGNITRAEFAKMLVEAFGISSKVLGEFSDVSDDAWYSSYIKIASGAGITKGYDGKFSPDNSISKQDAVVMLSRVASIFDGEYTGFREFVDMNDVSLYAWSAVGAFYSSGVINGADDQKFYPQKNISRAEASQLLVNFISSLSDRI